MRKRDSKRRWKARCAIGRLIPATAVLNYELWRWFVMEELQGNLDVYIARGRHGTTA